MPPDAGALSPALTNNLSDGCPVGRLVAQFHVNPYV